MLSEQLKAATLPRPLYLGQVATRCYLANQELSAFGLKQCNSRSRHKASVDLVRIKVVVSNWYTDGSGGEGTTNLTSTDFSVGVEYPAGTITQAKFSGANTAATAAGSNATTDWVKVSIPKGAYFFVRIYQNTAAGAMVVVGPPIGDTSNGDQLEAAPSGLTDRSASGTITDGGLQFCFYPSAIIGMTRDPSFYILGDSPPWGQNDSYSDTSGDWGSMARSIGPRYGYINGSRQSGGVAGFNASATRRVALASYCSHVIVDLGRLDLVVNGDSAATLQGRTATLVAMFPKGRCWAATLLPATTSANSWNSPDDQVDYSGGSGNSAVNTYNTWLKTIPAGFAGCWDVATAVSGSVGKWAVSAGAPFTGDGLHPNNAGCLRIAAAGVIRPQDVRFV